MNSFNNEDYHNINNDDLQEDVQAPAKVEKISLEEISQEINKQKNEKTEELVKRIMDKISEID